MFFWPTISIVFKILLNMGFFSARNGHMHVSKRVIISGIEQILTGTASNTERDE